MKGRKGNAETLMNKKGDHRVVNDINRNTVRAHEKISEQQIIIIVR